MVIMLPIVFILNGCLQESDTGIACTGKSILTGNSVWLDAVLFAVAVAVGLTPGMLPLIVSGNLARGAVELSKVKKKKSKTKN
jgi:Mg2+-importing ATPase